MATQQLQSGDRIPSFRLKNQNGLYVSSEELLGRPLVIYFYPKDDSPGCTAEACSFRDAYEDFSELGAEVIGISEDDPETHQSFAARHRLSFLLLSDEDNAVRRSFGVQPNLFGLLPGRVTFVVDAAGIVRYRFSSQLNIYGHVKKAKAFLESLPPSQR